jgi:hypothetical protein
MKQTAALIRLMLALAAFIAVGVIGLRCGETIVSRQTAFSHAMTHSSFRRSQVRVSSSLSQAHLTRVKTLPAQHPPIFLLKKHSLISPTCASLPQRRLSDQTR